MKREYKFLALLILGLFMFSFLAGVVSGADTTESSVKKFITENTIIKYIAGVVFGLWDFDKVSGKFAGGVVNDTGAIIAYLALWLVLMFAFGNIISIFSPFSEWVSWIVGVALVIAAAQLKLIFWLISLFALITAWLGAFSVFASIILAFVAFFLLSIGTEVIRKWAVKRKLAIEGVKAMKGRHRVSEGLKTLGDVGKEIADAGGI